MVSGAGGVIGSTEHQISALGTTLPSGRSAKASREFESSLLTSLFDSLQKSFSFDARDDTIGAGDYRLMATRALADAVSSKGGIGIGRLILAHLRDPVRPG